MKNIGKLFLFKSFNLSFYLPCSLHISHNLSYVKTKQFSQPESLKLTANYFPKITEDDLTPIDREAEDFEIKTVGDINHKLRLSRHDRVHDVDFYIRLIKTAAKEGNTEKMMTVFFHDMLITDRVKPTRLVIHILLGRLADLGGHSDAAFKIVQKMKDIRLYPTSVTYSLLFKNISKEIANNEMYYNLSNKSVKLLTDDEIIKIKLPAEKAFNIWKSNLENNCFEEASINALLLVLARAAMLKECFMVLDQFLEQGNRPSSYTLSAILEGCLHDRKSGFGLALLAFNKLVYNYKCSISPHVMTILLKVVKNCQFGNSDIIKKVISMSTSDNKTSFLEYHNISSISTDVIVKDSVIIHCGDKAYNENILYVANKYGIKADNFLQTYWSQDNNIAYVLKSPTHMLQKRFDNIFTPEWLRSNLEPSDKLACLGGVIGFVSFLPQNGEVPNVYTLTSLITCLPYQGIKISCTNPDEFFVSVIKKLFQYYKMLPENGFSNAIYKRNITCGIDDTTIIETKSFDPYTWSIYSKKCKVSSDVDKYFHLLEMNNLVVNKEIYLTVLVSVVTWGARLNVLKRMQLNKIDLNRQTIVHIENEIDKMRLKIKSLEEYNVTDPIKIRSFYHFQEQYAKILDKMTIEDVSTGDRKIFIDDLPTQFKIRRDK